MMTTMSVAAEKAPALPYAPAAHKATKPTNLFEITQAQLDKAAEKLQLDPAIHALLREPLRELVVSMPVRMDDGSVKVFKGFRVQYNDARGPNKGGIRFHPDETIDTVRALAAWMTWKTAVVDIPLGGGKGGVICNPEELSRNELERLSRAYIDAVGHMLGPDKDIPAPDVNTNPQVMAWMMDEYSKLVGHNSPGFITGKPIALGGSEGRGDATARGGAYITREAAKHLNIDLKNATVAIQGYGNVGRHAVNLFAKLLGCKIVAVSDIAGGIYCEDGIDPEALTVHALSTGHVTNMPGTKPLTNEELLALPVDILVPAAMENVITAENADYVKAKLVCELANGPTTLEADEILSAKNICVIPDMLANSGGVTVSYFEWVQNANHFYWEEEDVHNRLERKMTEAFNTVMTMSRDYRVDLRTAAYMVSVKRVAEAMKLRGWV